MRPTINFYRGVPPPPGQDPDPAMLLFQHQMDAFTAMVEIEKAKNDMQNQVLLLRIRAYAEQVDLMGKKATPGRNPP